MPDLHVGLAPDGFDDWAAVHALLTEAFAGLEGRIEPPSSLHRMSPATLAEMAQDQIVALAWTGQSLVGCGFGERREASLYLSKLAVRPDHQRRGILREMVGVLAAASQAEGLPALTLQTRIELAENHAAFRALGFVKTGETRHPGYDRTTSLTYRRAL